MSLPEDRQEIPPESIDVDVNWTYDDHNVIQIDFESMEEEFENRLKELQEKYPA